MSEARHAPYSQSERRDLYLAAFERLPTERFGLSLFLLQARCPQSSAGSSRLVKMSQFIQELAETVLHFLVVL
jgi:hypothetical protein